MRRSAATLLFFLLTSLSGLGCSDEAPATGRGMRGTRAVADEQDYEPNANAGDFERPRHHADVEPFEPEPEPPPPPPPTPRAEVPPRDLGAELAAAVGDPSACLTQLPPAVRSANVSVDAIVHPDGALSSVRASVSPGDAAAIACVQRLAQRARLAGEVPDAPRAIRSSVDVVR